MRTRAHFCTSILLLLATGQAGATTYHVAIGGSDLAAGTLANPWATLQHAVDNVDPGDVIEVDAGTYVGARIEASGTPAAPITLRAAAGDLVRLTSASAANFHDSILEIETFEGTGLVTDWVIEGFEVAGSLRYGIDLRSTRRVVVRGNVVHGSAVTGIFTAFSDDPLIEDNESFENLEHGVYHSNSGDRPIIRRNHLHDNAGSGVHLNADLSQGGDGVITGAVVDANRIHGNGTIGGSGINCDGVSSSVIRNNLIYDEHASGISLFQDDAAECSRNNLVANNTVALAANGRWALNMPNPGCTGNQLINNVFYTAHSFRGSISVWTPNPPGLVSHHNVVMDRFSTDSGSTRITLAQWQALGHEASSFIAAPADLFIDPALGDYRLAPGSDAVDAGVILAQVPTDLRGISRPQGPTHDAGAYEGAAAPMFTDGFESGGTGGWSAVVP